MEATNSSAQLYKPVLSSASKPKDSARRNVVYSAADVKQLNSNKKSVGRNAAISTTPKS
jgi:hypothetical protein